MVLQNEMKGPNELPETNLVFIHEANVASLVQINGIELHVSGRGVGGYFVAHKPPGEGADLIKGQMVVVRQDVDLLLRDIIPSV